MEMRTLIDVDILGHIFEQSITDLERLRHSLKSAAFRRMRPGNDVAGRKARSTPGLHHPLQRGTSTGQRMESPFRTLRKKHEAEATGTARKVLTDPNAYDLTR
jgi:hypothetical protein